MNAGTGWGLHRDAASVRVCLVDSGVAWGHPDLAANLAPMSEAYQALHTDRYGHGTHVAGIVGAVRGRAAWRRRGRRAPAAADGQVAGTRVAPPPPCCATLSRLVSGLLVRCAALADAEQRPGRGGAGLPHQPARL